MRRYLILIAYPASPQAWESFSAEEQAAFFEQHAAFSAYVGEHGREIASGALADTDTATTVRHVDGQVVVTDGPFAETTEMIGGFYEVELPDLDTAIAAVQLLPKGYTLEIRPIVAVS